MAKKMKAKPRTQSDHVYDLQHRREMVTTGGAPIPVNSHEVGDYIPPSSLPETHSYNVSKTGKITETRSPMNAEELLTRVGKRAQMRGGFTARTGPQKKNGQRGMGASPIMFGGGLY
jgi:hypothetical protein